jgi:hypothetical protein
MHETRRQSGPAAGCTPQRDHISHLDTPELLPALLPLHAPRGQGRGSAGDRTLVVVLCPRIVLQEAESALAPGILLLVLPIQLLLRRRAAVAVAVDTAGQGIVRRRLADGLRQQGIVTARAFCKQVVGLMPAKGGQ